MERDRLIGADGEIEEDERDDHAVDEGGAEDVFDVGGDGVAPAGHP